VIATRRLQRSFADGLIADAVGDLWEPWMRHADQALQDEALLLIIQQELAKRCQKSKTRGRPATTSEVILRLLLLKHLRDWSFEDLTREVRANLVYREFTRVGGGKVPDDKTMSRLARQLGPDVVARLHRRVVEIALEKKVATGRKLRVDTTVVETDIHYPTDSSLLGDGVRVLIPSLQQHIQQFGRAPEALAADPGFFSAANEAAAEKMGVKRVSIPANGTPGKQRRAKQKTRWFKKLQKWRTGCEGRISVLKRRHGLQRSRYKGLAGMQRWVGLGVIADNLIHIGDHMTAHNKV
jgi:IS5 family transposase